MADGVSSRYDGGWGQMTTNFAPPVVIRKETIIPSAPPYEDWGPITKNSAPVVVIRKDTKIPSAPPAPADGGENVMILTERGMSTTKKIILIILSIFTLSIAYHVYWTYLDDEFEMALWAQDLKAIQEVLDKGYRVGDYLGSKKSGRGEVWVGFFQKTLEEEAFREFLFSQPLLKEELKWVVSHIHSVWNSSDFSGHYCGGFHITGKKDIEGLFQLIKILLHKGELCPSDLSKGTKLFIRIMERHFGDRTIYTEKT